MPGDGRYLRRRKARRRRAAAQRLRPLRGAAGRRLRARSLRSRRVVGVGQFARGMTTARHRPRSRVWAWGVSALPAAVLLIWVVARLTRHL